MTEANTPRRKPQMPKQPRNRRAGRRGNRGKRARQRRRARKSWLPDRTSSRLMLQVLRVRHNLKGVCATKDLLCESLIDGSKKTQPIIKIKSTAKDLERQHRSLRRRIDFGMSRLRKRQNAIQREGVRISQQYAFRNEFRAAWSATAQRKRNKYGPHTPQELATRRAKANLIARCAYCLRLRVSMSLMEKF